MVSLRKEDASYPRKYVIGFVESPALSAVLNHPELGIQLQRAPMRCLQYDIYLRR